MKNPNLIGSILESVSRSRAARAQTQARRPSVVEALPRANRAAQPLQFVGAVHQLQLLQLDADGTRQDAWREQLAHVMRPSMRN